ncbi:MAG: EscN/YscN/HrcN family type III secretion system ATPase, partial [Euryarchaeota archaeon]
MEQEISSTRTCDKVGMVRKVTGLIIESEGPETSVGQVCTIISERSAENIEAQVVGFRENVVLLMALNSVHLIHPGCRVVSQKNSNLVPCGSALLGRIIDGMGRPIDGKGPLNCSMRNGFFAEPPNPLDRSMITEPFSTGIKALDTFVPLG